MKISAIARKGVLVVLLIFLAEIFAWLLCIIFQPLEPHYQEPQYEGKKLTDWAKEIDQGAFFGHPLFPKNQREQNELAIAAIRHIGTNALPVAVKLCGAKDSRLKTKLEEWIDQYNYDAVNHNLGIPKDQRRSQFPIRVTPAWDQHYYGANIICALGPAAKPIIPDLIRLLENQDQLDDETVTALLGAGTNAIPPLIELLDSTNQDVRLRAAVTLGDFFRPKISPAESNGSLIVTGSKDFRSQARAAVPVLLQYLDSGDINSLWRIRVLRALGLIGEDASVVVPILIRHIQSETNEFIRGNYFEALGSFGTNAKPVVPFLINILKSNPSQSNSWDKAQALGNLMRIDPEIAKPFLERWKASLTNASAEGRNPSVKHLERPTASQTNSASPP
ncbi:MAG: HEAT repeat domain-containing protein [Limisphaerales bacterium]